MRRKFDPGAAQSIEATQNISAKTITLVAAAGADATCEIFGNGGTELKLATKAGTTTIWPGLSNGFIHLEAPSTITVVGAGAWVRIDA